MYPATFLNSFISSNNFEIKDLGFSIQCVMPSANTGLSLFPLNLDTFHLFSFLIVVARISNTILNRSGESGHPCLVSEFSGRTFNFSPLSIMLAVDLS